MATNEAKLDLLHHHLKIEGVCPDALVDHIAAAIQRSARTVLRGDGKIHVSDVEDAVRIATGEPGEQAV